MKKKTWKNFSFPNRQVKDRLFRFIFENDRRALLDLYNGLNGTDYQNPEELQIITIHNVVYLSMKGDLAFVITGTLNLYEHQSTYNPNMPLRFLWYLAQEYQILVKRLQQNEYGSKLIKLPTPQCVVFYNGEKDMPDRQVLRLSDAFEKKEMEPCLELKVNMLNINYGHNRELMEKCNKLWEYAYFVQCIRGNLAQGMKLKKATARAMETCIENQVLVDFFRQCRSEVMGMILTEYNEKEYMRLFKRDAKREGRAEGITIGEEKKLISLVLIKLQKGKSLEKIAEELEEEQAQIEAIYAAAQRAGSYCDCEKVYAFLHGMTI